MCISVGMKRNNPRTGRPFRRGDIREDGMIFFNYTSRLGSDGFFYENWLTPFASERAKQRNRDNMSSKYVPVAERTQ